MDASTGEVTGLALGRCSVLATFDGGKNYTADTGVFFLEVTVAHPAQNIAVANPYGENPVVGVGGTLAVVNPPTVTLQNGAVGGGVIYGVTAWISSVL